MVLFPLLDLDTNLEALKPQGPNAWELPSPQGTQTECQDAASPGPGVSTELGLTKLEMEHGGAKHGHLAGAYPVISCKLSS